MMEPAARYVAWHVHNTGVSPTRDRRENGERNARAPSYAPAGRGRARPRNGRAWKADTASRAMRAAVLLVAVVAVACSGEPFTLTASEPFAYPAVVDAPLERIAIVVTITNRSEDDLQINPADFAARDDKRRIYPANPVATVADARLVRLAAGSLGMRDALPLPVLTLRKDDVLSGFIAFDVPAGVRPVQLIFRQSDADRVVDLSPPR